MDAVGTWIGAGISVLVFLMFALLKWIDSRKAQEGPLSTGARMNAAGFGLLPGIAVWKIFEQETRLAFGTDIMKPLPEIPFLTAEGKYAPCRIELAAALIVFLLLVLWMILRKNDIPGNGDVLLTVLCAWGGVRTLTETFRADPLGMIGSVDIVQIAAFLLTMIPLAVWSVRRERTQKGYLMAVLEWMAVAGCGTVMIMIRAGVLSAGSEPGDFAVLIGCALLSVLLVLLAGKDSRVRS